MELQTSKSLGVSADSGPRLLVLLSQNQRNLHRGDLPLFLPVTCIPVNKALGPTDVCVQDGFEVETMLTVGILFIYITVQSCACCEMTISLTPEVTRHIRFSVKSTPAH